MVSLAAGFGHLGQSGVQPCWEGVWEGELFCDGDCGIPAAFSPRINRALGGAQAKRWYQEASLS